MTYSRWALGDGASYAEKKARSNHPAHQRGTPPPTTRHALIYHQHATHSGGLPKFQCAHSLRAVPPTAINWDESAGLGRGGAS